MSGSLCDLATRLPYVVAALLDREASLKRGRFREETLTDIIVAALATFAGPHLIIQYPHEASTGGDLDLEFWNVRESQYFGLRVQSKRLDSGKINNKSVAIENRSYRELLHFVKSNNQYQFKTLIKSGKKYLPLYMFYNHQSVVLNPFYLSRKPQISGINLAFAGDIAAELESKLNALPSVLHHMRLSHLQKHFFYLSDILCSPSPAGRIPTPEVVSKSLRSIWARKTEYLDMSAETSSALRYLFEPDALHTATNPRRRLPDGPAIRISSEVKRPTATFISGATIDDRTPKII